MATFVLPILGPNTLSDTSSDVFLEPYSVKATNDRWPFFVLVFNKTATRIALRGLFRVPENFVGTPKIVIDWTSTVTSGNAVFDFEYRAVSGNDAESMDQTSQNESLTVTDAAPTAAHNRLTAEISLTAANLAPGDLVEFELYRDGTDAADTMNAAAIVFALFFSYADA